MGWPEKILKRAVRAACAACTAFGLLFLLLLTLCFTSVPWRLYHALGSDPAAIAEYPEYIVLLGGGGVPSESGLTRAFAAAELARRFDDATIILALPYSHELTNSAAGRMRDELVMRGVEVDRILIEREGRNTREQALNVARLIDADPRDAPVLLVTSPEHLKRGLLSFRKAGFGRIAGAASYSEAIEMNLLYDPQELGGRRIPVPAMAGDMVVRYQFWNNVGYLGSSARELVALAYYRLMGWI